MLEAKSFEFSKALRLGLGLILAAITVVLIPTSARADAPDPVLNATRADIAVNADGSTTIELWGRWVWSTHRGDCNDDGRSVGFAVDWNDAGGNYVGTVGTQPVNVGDASDNLVHPTPPTDELNTTRDNWRGGCGTYNKSVNYNSGVWGPIEHTYAPSYLSPIQPCVLMYDVHVDGKGKPKDNKAITAGGTGHNRDNSAEENDNTPLGNGCFRAPSLIFAI